MDQERKQLDAAIQMLEQQAEAAANEEGRVLAEIATVESQLAHALDGQGLTTAEAPEKTRPLFAKRNQLLEQYPAASARANDRKRVLDNARRHLASMAGQ